MNSDYLFVQPSFWSGFARTLDLYGQYDQYNISRTPVEADRKALMSDYLMLCKDCKQVADGLDEEIENATK